VVILYEEIFPLDQFFCFPHIVELKKLASLKIKKMKTTVVFVLLFYILVNLFCIFNMYFCFTSPDSKDRKMSKTQEKLLKLTHGQGQGHDGSQDAGLVSRASNDKEFR
jgi:hypothetical protein